MKFAGKLDVIPESLRKEFIEFASNNGTFLFNVANSFDTEVTELYRVSGEISKCQREAAHGYQKLFLDLILAEELDKAALAKLFQELFRLIADQNRQLEDCRESFFKDYRTLFNALTLYLTFVSNGGIDLDIAKE